MTRSGSGIDRRMAEFTDIKRKISEELEKETKLARRSNSTDLGYATDGDRIYSNKHGKLRYVMPDGRTLWDGTVQVKYVTVAGPDGKPFKTKRFFANKKWFDNAGRPCDPPKQLDADEEAT